MDKRKQIVKEIDDIEIKKNELIEELNRMEENRASKEIEINNYIKEQCGGEYNFTVALTFEDVVEILKLMTQGKPVIQVPPRLYLKEE